MSYVGMGCEHLQYAPPLHLLLSTAPSSTWQRASDTLELGQTLRPKRLTHSLEKETGVQRFAPPWESLSPLVWPVVRLCTFEV